MFNVGGGELIVIALIALIVLGPQRLPDAARQIGKTMGDLRRLSSGFQNEVRSALDTADDPNRVATRRNLLEKETPTSGDGANHPVRTEPLVAGPGLEPRTPPATNPTAVKPSAQARAAAKKANAAKAATPKNGTAVKKSAVKKSTKVTAAKKKPKT